VKDVIGELRRKQKRIAQLISELAGYDEKRRELAKLQAELREVIAVLNGESGSGVVAAKPKSRHGFVGGKRAKPIQRGSSVWWTAKVLFMIGQPMHITKILERIAKESGTTFEKNTVVSNLSRYVKYADTFNRPAPNTFGLIDFTKDLDPQEPVGFGNLALYKEDETE
jgi:hypothetical protein